MSEPKRGRPRESEPEPKSQAAAVFGQRLRSAREAAGKSRDALALEADVSADTIARYEDGAFEPKLVPAMRLAAALGLDFAALIGGLPIRGK